LTVAASGPTTFPPARFPVGARLARDGGLVADRSLSGVHIHFCGNGHLGFRPYGDSLFFQTPKKSKQKKARPERPAPRLGSAFLRSGIHLGASPPVGFASTSSRCVRLRRTALRASPQMNTSTQPTDGAGGSRSRAAGELTLGLLSGEKRKANTNPPVGAAVRRFDLLAKAAWEPTNLLPSSPTIQASLLAKAMCH
jgi:hypothetical protein